MGVFGIFSASKNTTVDSQPVSPDGDPKVEVSSAADSAIAVSAADSTEVKPDSIPVVPPPSAPATHDPPASHTSDKSQGPRRLSFRSLAPTPKHKPILSEVQEHEKKAKAANAFSKRFSKPLSSNSDKRAKESALIVRTLIVGPSTRYASPKPTKAVATPQLSKVKSELMQPNSANRVIAQLRALPAMDEKSVNDKATATSPVSAAPIHAVCLARTDAAEDQLHFSKLTSEEEESSTHTTPGVASASIDKLTNMLAEMHVIDLISAPDLGLGQPGDGKGILAGAVPTAETVIKGIEQLTPQLMALGYATGRAIYPDHKGVHPPTDRLSVLTYWWGLEVVLPPPTLSYLSNVQSISGTVVNFLTALSLINNGVREILPFVRYIAQFIDFEFSAIKRQDQGKGVVCASTWIMPAALVPRPWDFPPPEKAAALVEASVGDTAEQSNPAVPSPTTNPAVSIPLPTPISAATPITRNGPSQIPTKPVGSTPVAPPGVPSRLSTPVVLHNSQPALSPALALK
ncbi:hypothetical protein C8J57DRAFT_1167668 [Mycena rebaudengoi]|nr:hypothetical protein C8J57DRAFT_1167668 [Mycena rebaudengoi]